MSGPKFTMIQCTWNTRGMEYTFAICELLYQEVYNSACKVYKDEFDIFSLKELIKIFQAILKVLLYYVPFVFRIFFFFLEIENE